MPSPLPRQVRWSLFARLSPSSAAFPVIKSGRLLQLLFRGLLSVHSRYGLHARRVALCDPLHRRLQRLCYLHRRFDCFYEKVIKVKADVAALHCLISVLVAFGTSGPPSLRLLLFYFSCSLWLSPHFHRKCCVRIAQERRRATRSTHSSPRFVCLPVKPC